MANTATIRAGAAATALVSLSLALCVMPALAQAPAAGNMSGNTSTEGNSSTVQPPGSADLDMNYWILVRDSKDPDALQSYLQSFPSGRFADEARQKLAALRSQPGMESTRTDVPPQPPVPAAVAPPVDNKDLTLALQRELKRIGCLAGEADGVWGDMSRTALKNFVRHANLGINGDEPNLAALDAAQARRNRVCPLVCDDGEKVVGDRCVAAAPKATRPRQEQAEERKPRRAWAERPQPQAREPSSSSRGICFGPRPNEIVPCR